MEDLVHNYVSPCIMDLKMGNTMHDSYTDEEKYERQKAKVSASTSKTLGLRIAGIQVCGRSYMGIIIQLVKDVDPFIHRSCYADIIVYM